MHLHLCLLTHWSPLANEHPSTVRLFVPSLAENVKNHREHANTDSLRNKERNHGEWNNKNR